MSPSALSDAAGARTSVGAGVETRGFAGGGDAAVRNRHCRPPLDDWSTQGTCTSPRPSTFAKPRRGDSRIVSRPPQATRGGGDGRHRRRRRRRQGDRRGRGGPPPAAAAHLAVAARAPPARARRPARVFPAHARARQDDDAARRRADRVRGAGPARRGDLERTWPGAASERPAGIVFAQAPGSRRPAGRGEDREDLRLERPRGGAGPVGSRPPRGGGSGEAEGRRLQDRGPPRLRRRAEGRRRRAGAARRGRAAEESTVVLTVSKGRNLKPVPDVVGLQEGEAVSRLRAAGFEPRIFDVPSPEPQGIVVAQQPAGGEQAPPDSASGSTSRPGKAGQTTERPTTTTRRGARDRPERRRSRTDACAPAPPQRGPPRRRLLPDVRPAARPRDRAAPTRGRAVDRDAPVQLVVSSGATAARRSTSPT